ncbi:hypothetical protein Tco_1460550 [Tanacetum coccineum]
MHYVSATASSKSNESPSKNNELELVVMVLHFMLLKRGVILTVWISYTKRMIPLSADVPLKSVHSQCMEDRIMTFGGGAGMCLGKCDGHLMTAKLGPEAQVIMWSKPGGLEYLLYVIKSPQSSMILPADHVLHAVINARLSVPLLLLVCFWSYLFHVVMLSYQVGNVPLTWSNAVLLFSG